jgi:2-dehydro-3-deoxyphosphogalactonate aldolase
VVTPTEAFAALEAGATALKLFPAEGSSPAILKAMRAVLPKELRLLPVGGIAPDNMGPWREAGADGFGLGSALYKIGFSAAEVGERAKAFVSALAR